ncbi:carboxymuconolactone decarboxylase family protein [Runella sp.]|uniref:carboxymuconolactone decarboxylase family protein n=1 Tax=Runella sp. TaxID=1960881 RepID=UPI003D0C265B
MARIKPLVVEEAPFDIKEAFQKHVSDYPGSRITNMKATLGHAPLAFEVYMQWYPLYEKIKQFLGNRQAYLYSFSISQGSNCPLCSTFFRKIIIENGESPDRLQLSEEEELLLEFGSQIAQHQGRVPDDLYEAIRQRYSTPQVILLVAFAGQMVATNVFNNALEVEIDEYLSPYLPLTQTSH